LTIWRPYPVSCIDSAGARPEEPILAGLHHEKSATVASLLPSHFPRPAAVSAWPVACPGSHYRQKEVGHHSIAWKTSCDDRRGVPPPLPSPLFFRGCDFLSALVRTPRCGVTEYQWTLPTSCWSRTTLPSYARFSPHLHLSHEALVVERARQSIKHFPLVRLL